MKLIKTTPDGTFTVTIESVFTDPDEDVPDESLQQLVQLLDQTANLFRVSPASTAPIEEQGCIKTPIAEDCCYVQFGPVPPLPSLQSSTIGTTVRGERLIADFDAEGRIIGLELIGGPAKPCQVGSVPMTER